MLLEHILVKILMSFGPLTSLICSPVVVLECYLQRCRVTRRHNWVLRSPHLQLRLEAVLQGWLQPAELGGHTLCPEELWLGDSSRADPSVPLLPTLLDCTKENLDSFLMHWACVKLIPSAEVWWGSLNPSSIVCTLDVVWSGFENWPRSAPKC